MKYRRKLLKALSVAGAAGTVDSWKKPVVNAVTLPAHAQGSLCSIDIDYEITLSGNYGGSGGYEFSVYEGSEISNGGFEANSNATTIRNYSFPVDPGTYLVCAGAGAEGSSDSGSGSVTISCCEDNWVGTFSASGDDGDSIDTCLIVVVGAAGGCSFEEPD